MLNINHFTYFLPLVVLYILLAPSVQARAPTRKRYMVPRSQHTNHNYDRFHSLSAIKVNDTYTQVKYLKRQEEEQSENMTSSDSIVPIIQSINEIRSVDVYVTYRGKRIKMEIKSIQEIYHAWNKTVTNFHFHCDNCNRYFYENESCFSHSYCIASHSWNNYDLCPNCAPTY